MAYLLGVTPRTRPTDRRSKSRAKPRRERGARGRPGWWRPAVSLRRGTGPAGDFQDLPGTPRGGVDAGTIFAINQNMIHLWRTGGGERSWEMDGYRFLIVEDDLASGEALRRVLAHR